MATFAIRFAQCEHQDKLQIVYTVKAGDTASDLLKEMHPHSSKTHKICVIGHAEGAAVCPTSKGYEVDVESSTPLAELRDLGFKSLHLCCTRIAEEPAPMEAAVPPQQDAFSVLMSGARKRSLPDPKTRR